MDFTNTQEIEKYAREVAGVMIERHLFEMMVRDPLEKYEREQDHFVKHAPKWEVAEWEHWNKTKKESNFNKYGATKSQFMRELGCVPGYIEFYMEKLFPGYWDVAKEGPAREHDMKRVRGFYKRNPLFCTAEVI